MRRLLVALCLVGVLLWGCSTGLFRSKLTCDEVEQLISYTGEMGSIQRNDMPEWIQSTFNINEEQINRDIYGDSRVAYSHVIEWRDNDKDYKAAFFDQELARISADFRPKTITVEEIIACLGAPEAYLAFKARMMILEMWYPERGIILRAARITNDWNIDTAIETMEASTVYLFRPGSLEEAAILTSTTLTNVETRSSLLKPWTSEWRDMSIEPLPVGTISPQTTIFPDNRRILEDDTLFVALFSTFGAHP